MVKFIQHPRFQFLNTSSTMTFSSAPLLGNPFPWLHADGCHHQSFWWILKLHISHPETCCLCLPCSLADMPLNLQSSGPFTLSLPISPSCPPLLIITIPLLQIPSCFFFLFLSRPHAKAPALEESGHWTSPGPPLTDLALLENITQPGRWQHCVFTITKLNWFLPSAW